MALKICPVTGCDDGLAPNVAFCYAHAQKFEYWYADNIEELYKISHPPRLIEMFLDEEKKDLLG